jgi:putative nucleotidyltransferase with HDIG domain
MAARAFPLRPAPDLRAPSWPSRHIHWKIILPYGLVVLTLAAVSTYITTQLVTGSLTERFDNQLVQAGRVTADSVVRQERHHLEVARAAAFTDGLSEAIQAGDSDRAGSLVQGIVVNAGIERLEILDARGQRVRTFALADEASLTYGQLADSDKPAEWPPVQRVLQRDVDQAGDKHADIVETSAGLVLYTATPVTQDGQLRGVVLAGTSIKSLLAGTKAEALADVTIYDSQGSAMASTFVAPADASSSEAKLDTDAATLARVVESGDVARERRTIWGREYDLLYGPLSVRGQTLGAYSAGLPSDFIFSASNDTRWQMALIFGIGMGAVLAVGLYIARAITRPVQELVETAERISAGDFTARSNVRTGDEIGRLATCLNQMTDKLQGQYLATLRALASAVAASNPYTVGHSVRVGRLSMLLGSHLGLSDKTLAQLEIGGYLHDIGKIGIRDSIVLESPVLSATERIFIREHPHIGLSILDHEHVQQPVIEFVGININGPEKHEKAGLLPGDDLPIVARIVAIADMYDALTAPQDFGEPMTSDQALEVIRAHAGSTLHFGTVEKLAAIIPEWEKMIESDPSLRGPSLRAARTS